MKKHHKQGKNHKMKGEELIKLKRKAEVHHSKTYTNILGVVGEGRGMGGLV
jgi:hypothetical protein